VDEDALETREGSRIARRVQTGGRKRHPLLLVAAGLARAAVRSYPFWLGVGAITALLVYYAWRS
jgi:hypothetical protein